MLTLVSLGARHARDLDTLAGDDPDPPWTTAGPHSPRQNVLAFVAAAQRLRARGARETFAVCHMGGLAAGPPNPPTLGAAPGNPGRSSRYSEGFLVGIAMLAWDPPASDRAEMGYWIGPADRGRGYATEAARQILTRGFGRMKLALVFARCPSANRASARVVEKLGFRFVGLEPALEHPESVGETIRRYEMTRDEWLER